MAFTALRPAVLLQCWDRAVPETDKGEGVGFQFSFRFSVAQFLVRVSGKRPDPERAVVKQRKATK